MAAPMMGKGRELPLAAPLTGKGREMRVVVVVLWRAGWVSLEAWEKVWEWFGDVGNGDRAENWREMPPGAQVRGKVDPGMAVGTLKREVGTLAMAPIL